MPQKIAGTLPETAGFLGWKLVFEKTSFNDKNPSGTDGHRVFI
jgi:hypothetical protein